MDTLTKATPRTHRTSNAPYATSRVPVRQRFTSVPNTPRSKQGKVIVFDDERSLLLRRIRPSDGPALQRGFSHLTPDEVRMRFLHPITALSEDLLEQLCALDPDRAMAYVLATPDGHAEPEIHAVARVYVDPVTESGEFALIVQKQFAGLGLGRMLMRRLIAACRRRGVRELWGDVLVENGIMLDLCLRLGFQRESSPSDAGLTRVRLTLE